MGERVGPQAGIEPDVVAHGENRGCGRLPLAAGLCAVTAAATVSFPGLI